jgi:hypothetical protein
LITEFIVDGRAEFRLGTGSLLGFGVLRGLRVATDRADRRFVRGHRDEWDLPPPGFLRG